MNRKKSIEYSNKTWNPYTGCYNWDIDKGICGLGTDCWAYGMAQRLKGRYGYDSDNPFMATFHPDKLDIPLHRKKPTIYATSFMGDIGYCYKEWMDQIIDIVKKCPQHTFLFLTKMPSMVRQKDWPDNAWLGVTVETNNDLIRLDILRRIDIKHRWASFEPPRGIITPNLENINGIAIGGKTGKHPYQPSYMDITHLISMARKYESKIVLKDNLDFNPKVIEWP